MKILEQDHPCHFCLSDKCNYFRHTDIFSTDEPKDVIFCISSIGELPPQEPFLLDLMVGQWEKINCDTIYEIMVFDKISNNPWSEIEQFRSNDRNEIIQMHEKFILKYVELAQGE